MWPEFYPTDCPPPDAKPTDLTAYRLVSAAGITPEDFVPHLIAFPERRFKEEELCAACGLSVYSNQGGAAKLRRRYKPLRTKKIAKGHIMEKDGLVAKTGDNSHQTWWPLTDTPHLCFNEVL